MSVEAAQRSEVDVAMARSWLLVPAVGSEVLAAASGADSLIIDLEDGLPFAAKDEGAGLHR